MRVLIRAYETHQGIFNFNNMLKPKMTPNFAVFVMMHAEDFCLPCLQSPHDGDAQLRHACMLKMFGLGIENFMPGKPMTEEGLKLARHYKVKAHEGEIDRAGERPRNNMYAQVCHNAEIRRRSERARRQAEKEGYVRSDMLTDADLEPALETRFRYMEPRNVVIYDGGNAFSNRLPRVRKQVMNAEGENHDLTPRGDEADFAYQRKKINTDPVPANKKRRPQTTQEIEETKDQPNIICNKVSPSGLTLTDLTETPNKPTPTSIDMLDSEDSFFDPDALKAPVPKPMRLPTSVLSDWHITERRT